MATYRGFSVGGTSIPVSSVNVTNARNPITEVTMGSVGSPKIYGGTYSASGSIEMPFRKTPCGTLIGNLFGGSIASGVVDLPSNPWLSTVIVADEYGFGMSFASAIITSMDLSMQVKDYCKCTFNFLGIKGTTGTVGALPDYQTDTIPIFYNAMLTVGSVTTQAFGVTIHVERPIDTDYYVLGSPFLQDATQSGAVVLSGTLTLSPKEATILNNAINSVSSDTVAPSSTNKNAIDLGTGGTTTASLVLLLNSYDGASTLQTITIDQIKLSDWSLSANGREKVSKTLNWLGIIDGTTYNIKLT